MKVSLINYLLTPRVTLLYKSLSILFLALMLAFSSNVNAEQSLEKVSLQLSWKYQFEFAGFIMAKEKGFYRSVGLDVDLIEYNENILLVDDVLSQKINYGVHNTNIVIQDRKVVPTVLLATYFQQSPHVFVASPTISHPIDLIGKRIMSSKTELINSSLGLLLDHYNITAANANFTDHSFNIDDFANNKVDVMTAYLTNEVYELQKQDIAYSVIDPMDFGISMSAVNLFTSHAEALAHPNRTHDFVNASNKGWAYALSHIEETIAIIKQQYAPDKSYEALKYEATISKRLMLLDFFDIGETSKESSLRIVKQLKYSGLLDKEEELGVFLFEDVLKNTDYTINFTDEEIKYLNQKENITMCIDPEWMPFEAIKNGKHIGITADVIALFNRQLPIPIVLEATSNWAESLLKAKRRQCDIFSLAASTPERTSYMDFTEPYINLPIVMATQMGVTFIDDIAKVQDKPIGVVKGYSIGIQLRKAIPGINIVDVESISRGLERVESGELFGYIDNLMVISDSIQKEFTGVLKVSSRLKKEVKLAIGTRNDQPLLGTVFETLITNLKDNELQTIYNKWVVPESETIISYSLVWKLLLAAILLGFAYIFHVLKLTKLNDQLQVLSTTDKLTGLYNRLKTDHLLIEKKAEVNRYEVDVSIILFDIDLFKGINDRYGHLVGDSVLVEFAQILQHNIRETDFVGRWGGEEFIIICPNIDVQESTRLANKLLNKISKHSFDKVSEKVTASAGVSQLEKEATLHDVIRNADKALYQSKENGRNQVSTIVK